MLAEQQKSFFFPLYTYSFLSSMAYCVFLISALLQFAAIKLKVNKLSDYFKSLEVSSALCSVLSLLI